MRRENSIELLSKTVTDWPLLSGARQMQRVVNFVMLHDASCYQWCGQRCRQIAVDENGLRGFDCWESPLTTFYARVCWKMHFECIATNPIKYGQTEKNNIVKVFCWNSLECPGLLEPLTFCNSPPQELPFFAFHFRQTFWTDSCCSLKTLPSEYSPRASTFDGLLRKSSKSPFLTVRTKTAINFFIWPFV